VTTALIFLPLAGALVVALLPLPRRLTEGLALLVALAECGLGAVALIGFDANGGQQYVENRDWISDFGLNTSIRYHVSMDGLSLFMVLLAAVGIAAAAGAAIRMGRERPRAYFALLLVLEFALVLLFTAQDLVLFYVGWEIMMIPLYVLIGVWGGDGRRAATIQFVVYTLAGSLLMLVAIAYLGVTAGTFERQALVANPHEPTWLFFAFAAAFCIKAPLFPLHAWLPSAYRESSPEVAALLSGAIDAGTMSAPWDARAISQGYGYVVYGPDLAIPQVAVSFITRRSFIAQNSPLLGRFMRAMAEASKIVHTDRDFWFKVLGKYLRISDRKVLESAYNAEIKALEPRLTLKLDSLQAILDELAQTDPRAKNVKPQEMVDSRYLDEMNKSGFMDQLWSKK